MSITTGLKKSYYKYVDAINVDRNWVGNKFYESMATTIWKATEAALNPTIDTMHIVAAQTGSAKSTYMEAMTAALCKAGYSVAIVAKTINQCHKIYINVTLLLGQPTGRELNEERLKYFANQGKLSANQVAIYTSVHKFTSSSDSKKHNIKPSEVDYYTQEEKSLAPVVISTHTALMNELDENIDLGIQKQDGEPRNVVFLDETPEFNLSMSIEKWEIEEVQSLLLTSRFVEHRKAISKLLKRYQKVIDSTQKGQYSIELDLLRPKLKSLFSRRYDNYDDNDQISLLEHFDRKGKSEVFNKFLRFVNALEAGQKYYTRNNRSITFSKNIFKNNSAFILLDATSELEQFDFYNNLPKESKIDSPFVDYKNTRIKYILPPTKFSGTYLTNKKEDYMSSFCTYIIDTVIKNSQKGEKLLIVVRKGIADRFYSKFLINAYKRKKKKGRKINIIYWGNFIGSNEWKHIKKVFLFTGYQRPKDIYIGLDAAYQGEVTEEFLREQSGGSLVGRTLKLKENESIKWFKQLAARGNIRNINDKGEAGEMEIYTDTDLLWLIQNQERAFPKSPRMEFIGNNSGGPSEGGLRIVLFLAYHKTGICTYQDLVKVGHYSDESQMNKVLTRPGIKEAISYLGWIKVFKGKIPEFDGPGRMRLVNWELYN